MTLSLIWMQSPNFVPVFKPAVVTGQEFQNWEGTVIHHWTTRVIGRNWSGRQIARWESREGRNWEGRHWPRKQ